MEILGYKVSDIAQGLEYFTQDWNDYFDQKVDLEKIIQKYDQVGFHATADLPFNSHAVEARVSTNFFCLQKSRILCGHPTVSAQNHQKL